MATQTFNAAEWFATWCEHGGIVMLIGDAVWIGRHPEAQSALAGLLRANAAQSEQMMEG